MDRHVDAHRSVISARDFCATMIIDFLKLVLTVRILQNIGAEASVEQMNDSTSSILVQVFEANHIVGSELLEDICNCVDLEGGKIFSKAFEDYCRCVQGIVQILIIVDRERRKQLAGGFTHATESVRVEILQKMIIVLALAEEHQLFDRESLIRRSQGIQ